MSGSGRQAGIDPGPTQKRRAPKMNMQQKEGERERGSRREREREEKKGEKDDDGWLENTKIQVQD